MKQTFEQLHLTPVQLITNRAKLEIIPFDRKMITSSFDSGTSEKTEEELDEKEPVTHGMHKKAGNCAYKNGDYDLAITNYTLAINNASDLDSSNVGSDIIATYYTNRAAAYAMILKFNEALADCNLSLNVIPNFSKALIRKANIQFKLGRLNEAKDSFSTAKNHHPQSAGIKEQILAIETAQLRFERAEMMLSNQSELLLDEPYIIKLPNEEDAKQALSEIHEVEPFAINWIELLIFKVRALLSLCRFGEAFTLTTRIIHLNYEFSDGSSTTLEKDQSDDVELNSDFFLMRAYSFFGLGSIDYALKLCRSILRSDPDNDMAAKMYKILRQIKKEKEKGDDEFNSKQFGSSIRCYTQALNICPKSVIGFRAILYFNRGTAHNRLKDYEKAVENCTSALHLNNQYFKAYMLRASSNIVLGGVIHLFEGQEYIKCALNDYEKALELSKDEEKLKQIQQKIEKCNKLLNRDYYNILGVNRESSFSDIKKAYRKLALRWHPDRVANGTILEKENAEKIFRDINFAYECLSDQDNKQHYDLAQDRIAQSKVI